MDGTEQRLSRIRGAATRKRHNARTIAALTSNPGCARRAILDAAGVDKELVAGRAGFPAAIGQLSPIAVARGNSFEETVKENGCAELLRLLRKDIGLPVPQAHHEDLGTVGDDNTPSVRYGHARRALRSAVAAGVDAKGTLFDHPLLRLAVGGVLVYLEPDLIAYRLQNRFYIIEIKSFPILDEHADPVKVLAAARQSAVYVIALQNLLQEADCDPGIVSHDVVLVCPRDFTNQPTAALVDVRKQIAAVRRQLTRMDAIDALLDAVPGDITFDLLLDPDGKSTRSAADLASALRHVDARYAPECLASCEMAKFCREEARGRTNVLGRTVREDLGGVDYTSTVLALARGQLKPSSDLVQAAGLLRTALQLRNENAAVLP